MKLHSLLAVSATALLLNMRPASAAVVLNEFGEFEISGAYDSPEFRDSWLGQGVQNIDGTYELSGGATNASSSGVDFYFPEPTDFTGQEYLAITVKLLDGNETSSFNFQLFDSNGLSAVAVFDTALFSFTEYRTLTVAFAFDSGFDAASVEQWTLTGGIPGGEDRFAIGFDSAVAVPEPYSLGMLAVGFLTVWLARLKKQNRAVVA